MPPAVVTTRCPRSDGSRLTPRGQSGGVYLFLVHCRMGRTTSVSLDEFQDFIAEQIATKEFRTSSEVIRAALRDMKKRAERRAALSAFVAEGVRSGLAADSSRESIFAQFERERATGIREPVGVTDDAEVAAKLPAAVRHLASPTDTSVKRSKAAKASAAKAARGSRKG